MEHIKQFDWCYTGPDSQNFIEEEDIDNSCIQRILSNKFMDPLNSSASEDEEARQHIDWNSIFTQTKNKKNLVHRVYVPGLRVTPTYPKQSALSPQQQFQILKVLCAQHPSVLESEFVPRPTKLDYKLYEDLKEKYEKEQTEYQEWARSLWIGGQNIRALRPKPQIETVYDAEFKLRMTEINTLPKHYEMAAQIPLVSMNTLCEMVLLKELIKVNIADIPQVQVSDLFNKKISIIRPSTVPEPCAKHPCRFILPTEKSVSILPLPEVQGSLAQFASEHGAQYVISEAALRRLVQHNQPWMLPVTVCSIVGPDGDKEKIVVMGNDFTLQKECSQARTYRAFRHLLRHTLIPKVEKQRVFSQFNNKDHDSEANSPQKMSLNDTVDCPDSDDEENLIIDYEERATDNELDVEQQAETDVRENNADISEELTINPLASQETEKHVCSCLGSFERPYPRSYKKWEVHNSSKTDSCHIVVHCSHKSKNKSNELILEPLPEYQIDLGGSELTRDRCKSLALSLMLRKNASVMLVRVDAMSGDIVTSEFITLDDINKRYPDVVPEVTNAIYTALTQLQGLMPGSYLLKHDMNHGANALLFACTMSPPQVACHRVVIQFDTRQSTEEATSLIAPVLTPTLLPVHKFRKILPCAFTPFANNVMREVKKPAAKHKPPPAIKSGEDSTRAAGNRKWPKRKRNKRKVNGGGC